jgi:hypothetical protein
MNNNSFCSNCLFWKPPDAGQPNPMGQCRRYSPKAFMVMAQAPGSGRIAAPGPMQTQQIQPIFLSAWSPVPPDGWCGQHEAVDLCEKRRSLPAG